MTWRAVEKVMGLPISVAMRGRHAGDEAGQRAWQRAVASLREADRIFSTYREDSVISALARGDLELDDCPAEVHEVFALADTARIDSAGAFDIHLPTPQGATRLDPSGVVKGWAVQRASAYLRDLEQTDVCLGAGGDIVCWVSGADAEPWQVGIEDPHDPQRVLARVAIRDGAIATSGAAHRGAHVVHARTGRAPSRLASVSVIAEDLTTADIEATAAFALDGEALAWLRQRGRNAVVVDVEGRLEVA